jgi:hypothetical protein
MNLRDPIMYRIRHAHHHQTGDKWCIYPNYDFTHGQSDAIEGITHSICTLEFESHRPLYEWFLDSLPVPAHPRQYEFSRLNLNYTITSKRIVIRYGAAIQKHVNLPFRAIQAVGLRTAPDGTGDIVMTPEADRNLSYLLLWPHVRAGKRGRVEPVLRGIPDAAGAARVLAAALDPSRAPAAIMPIAASPLRDRSQDSDAMDALASRGHAA